MKVLKGFYKGSEIISPDVKEVRPTVDHFKKHILRIFGEKPHAIVWDLFAGSGGVGLELLSNGARQLVFVEQLKAAMSCLKLNLSQAQLKNPQAYGGQKVSVIQGPVEGFLKNPGQSGVTEAPDFVFLDPPYGQNWMIKIIPLLLACPLANEKTFFVCEHVAEDAPPADLAVATQEVYGPKVLTCFYGKTKG